MTVFAGVLCLAAVGAEARIVVDFNSDWRFSKDGGVARRVDLPHDWAVDGGFTFDVAGCEGHLPYPGVGTYRKSFETPQTLAADGRLWLEIDGAMCHSSVRLNGRLVSPDRPYGYVSYKVDLTDALKPRGETNDLEIRLDVPPKSTRYYSGAGLYRDVRLVEVAKTHVAYNGLHVRTEKTADGGAVVCVDVEVEGGGRVPFDCRILRRGKVVATGSFVAPTAELVLAKPDLWSPETPNLYALEVALRDGGKVCDSVRTTFGVRTVEFRPGQGFFLNGVHRQMKGVCLHHDFGPLGAAFHRDAARRQLLLMKEMGADAVRTTHNPPSPKFLDLCDELGLMVMDEAFDVWELKKNDNDYHRDFAAWHARDLADFVKRDRNHPCVMLWSIGNEVPEHHDDSARGYRIGTNLVEIVHRYDARPTTVACWWPGALTNEMHRICEVMGANYLPWWYTGFIGKNPDKLIIGSETESVLSSRGVYFYPWPDRPNNTHGDDPQPFFYAKAVGERGDWGVRPEVWDRIFRDGQVSGYDVCCYNSDINHPPDSQFKYQDLEPRCCGMFTWTGMDYLGEPTPYLKPDDRSRSSYFGACDLCGFPKDRFWLFKSFWRPDVPTAHILPHWNWKDGVELPVHVYSSGDAAELFVNGKSQGVRKRGKFQYRFVWEKVRYEPGEVKVVTWKKGTPWATETVRTSGAFAKIVTEREYEGEELVYYRLKAVDGDGNFVPTANVPLQLTVTGGTIAGVCNGDATDWTPFKSDRISTFNGLAQVIVKGRNARLSVQLRDSAEFVSPESDLAAKLPGIFAKSAAHYRALDAAVTPLVMNPAKAKGEGEEARFPHGWNTWRTGRDEYDMRSIYWWTSGHFAGSFWYLYEATGDDFFKRRATAWTERLAPNSLVTNNHDVGFIMYCSYGNARRILKTDKYDALLVQTANSLCTRYNKKLGLLRSWGHNSDTKTFEVIPDNLMNLELLEFASGCPASASSKPPYHDGRARSTSAPLSPADFDRIARSHADVTMKNHFRPDGGCWHVLDYDQKTGKVQKYYPGQGLSVTTAWARGESWAIYGYTMMYRTTGYVRYLDFAKKLADYAMNHPNMPADGIPYWDYGAPGEERDTSAGSIMASALLELSQYVGAADRDRYRAFAVKQLLSLASDAYFSKGNEIGHFLLKHGVGHKPGKSEINTPLDYGDYYFLEALIRFRQLKAREKAVAERIGEAGCGAAGVRALPAKAALAPDELQVRSRVAATKAAEIAAKALAEQIPDTPDELYGEYWTTGNRTHYQDRFFARLRNLDALALVAAGFVNTADSSTAGRARSMSAPSPETCLARIEDYLNAICDMKSWVLPAHDWPDGGRGVWRGTWISTDLFSTEVAAHLACVLQLVGPRLKPETVARVKANVERRVFAPVRREVPRALFGKTAVPGLREWQHWWINGENNWNAVCWDNVVCAALGLIDDPTERAFFVAAADKAADRYIADGFAADGYCSEGMGYWNYGFGHHLMTGRLLNRVTGGKFDFFRTAARSSSAPYQRGRKEALAAAYARAYTLAPGVSPAFADGNGAADPLYLGIVDEFWPDLPKELPPTSEFPDGQVWLFRDPKGLSVAFKGGHNDELHNHNDLGSYYIVADGQFVAGDPGGEEYTRRTFSRKRYESKVLNSYGHPVPVVGGKLQGTGRKYAAKVVSKKIAVEGQGQQSSEVVLDLTAGYDVKTLKKLTRTFVYDRPAKTFRVKDHVEFTEPTAFEDCYVTLEGDVGVGNRCRCTAVGQSGSQPIGAKAREETIENPNRKTLHRFAWTFEKPVTEAEVVFKFE